MKKTYSLIYSLMVALDMGYDELADAINRSRSYVADRMRGAANWDMADQWNIIDAIGAKESDMHLLFPRLAVYNGRVRSK